MGTYSRSVCLASLWRRRNPRAGGDAVTLTDAATERLIAQLTRRVAALTALLRRAVAAEDLKEWLADAQRLLAQPPQPDDAAFVEAMAHLTDNPTAQSILLSPLEYDHLVALARQAAPDGWRCMIGCYRYCNHCGTDIQSASAWVHHAVTIAKSFGHRDDIWLREATRRERELIGESIYAHIRDAAAIRDSRSAISPTRVL